MAVERVRRALISVADKTGLGEFAADSVHFGPRVGGSALADLVKAWRRRGDVTTWGGVLIDALERLGVVKPTRPKKESGS